MMDDLETKQAMFTAIIESSEDAIISKSLDSIILSWNRAAERLFEYTEAEAVGKHIFLIIPPSLHNEEEMIIKNLKMGKVIEHFRTLRLKKNGQLIPISLTISPIKDVAGNIIGASKIARDITKEKQDEEVIYQYARSLEAIITVSTKISSKLDYRGILQLVTDAATELTGATFGAFFQKNITVGAESYRPHALAGTEKEAFENFDILPNAATINPAFFDSGVIRSDNITKDLRHQNAGLFNGIPSHMPVVSLLAVPVISQIGSVTGGLFFSHPQAGKFKREHEQIVVAIAAQAAIALDNSKLYEDIQLHNTKKDEFIRMASHELKTPLTTISGYLQIAENDPTTISTCLPKITKQVKRLQKMIGDLLDISKIQAGKLEFEFAEVSLHKIIKESVESIQFKDYAIQHNVPAEDIMVTVDADKMLQVLINLLSNAIKYSMKNSLIKITATLAGSHVQIAVSDEGIGIAQKELNSIFNQFYRIPQSANVEGTGLGLFICKEIIENHHGKIWVESVEGTGSTFYISFPMDPGK